MANKSFDFNKVKRSNFSITLKDGTKLQVKMPVKKVFEKLLALDVTDATENADALGTLDTLCAELLSNNVAGHEVSTEYMAEKYDFEEKFLFLDAYMDFVNSVKADPN